MADPQPTTQDATGTLIDQTPTQTTTTESTGSTDPSQAKTEGSDALIAKEPPSETKPETGPPAQYGDFTLPEGYELDGDVKSEIHSLFKDSGLTQAQAQKYIDFYIKHTNEALQAPYDTYQEVRKGWREEAQNHPDLKGKLGAGREVSVSIGRMLDSLANPQLAQDFRQAMDYTGVGDNPAFIRVFYALAKQVTEGSHVAGKGPNPAGQPGPHNSGGTAAGPPTAAQAMWPNLPSQR